MKLSELKKLVEEGESEVLELKTSTANIKSAVETICAFLNAKGGTVLIGVNDAGKIIGQTISDATKREIAKELAKIEPAAQPSIEYISFQENKKVIHIKVDAGAHAPYTYDGRPYQRSQSTTERMSQHRYEQMIVMRGQLNHSWESALEPNLSLNDLDVSEIKRTISVGEQMRRLPISVLKSDINEVLERLSLSQYGKINRAAVVLFGDEKSIYPHCEIKMARFRGINKTGDFIDNKHIKGHAFKLLDEADAFMSRHLPVEGIFDKDKFTRTDKPILPVLAVREALVNAIIHRDYSRTGTSIHLGIYDDRLEIWNYGSLSKELTIEALRTRHQSILRNEIIANIFYIRDLVEAWGTGTNKMIELCRQEKIPEPIFEEDTGGLMVIFKFKKIMSKTKTQLTLQSALNEREQAILMLLKNSSVPLSANEIFSQFSNLASLRTLKADLNNLKQLGLVRQIGQARRTLWGIDESNGQRKDN